LEINLGPLEAFDQDPEIHTILIGIAIMFSSFHFFYPVFYSRKQNLARGLFEAIRIMETNGSRLARQNLFAKYEKNLKINETDLKKSGEKVRSNLLMLQNWMQQKGIPRKTILDFYSYRLYRSITCYLKFLEEFYPNHEIEPQIKQLYKNCHRRYKHKSSNVLVRNSERAIEGLLDKFGM
jgi:hypothetical protein